MIGLFPKSSTREVTCSRLLVAGWKSQVAGRRLQVEKK